MSVHPYVQAARNTAGRKAVAEGGTPREIIRKALARPGLNWYELEKHVTACFEQYRSDPDRRDLSVHIITTKIMLSNEEST